MRDTFVIDGYNLIHALGMIQKNMAAGGLKASRRQLLEFLAQRFGDDAVAVTVVFDAQHAPRGLARQQTYQGLNVQFAPKGQSADDWIETRIENETQPGKLVIVSNDARLQNAARQAGARAWSDQALLDFFENGPRAAKQPECGADDRAPMPTPAEAKEWLKEFEGLDADPDLKEFFDYDRFDEE